MKSKQHAIAAGTVLLIGSVALLCSFSVGSLKPKEPTIKYEKVDVKKVSFKETKVEFVYSVENPNSIGLENVVADYELFLGAKDSPAEGTAPTVSGKDVTFNIKAKDTSEFRLPMDLNYEGIFKSAAELTRIIVGGQKSIPFVLKTTFHLDLKILKFKIPIESKGELPLPEVSGSKFLSH